MISPEETQRRRVHVRVGISENRLEGIATSAATQKILDAYIRGEIEAGIRGEIEAGDLVTTFLQSLGYSEGGRHRHS